MIRNYCTDIILFLTIYTGPELKKTSYYITFPYWLESCAEKTIHIV